MTNPKRTNSTLRAMLTRRDKKIADLINQNADLHAELAGAVRLAKQLGRENAMLRNNIEVLQRPHRLDKRNSAAARRFDALQTINKQVENMRDVLRWYERETRETL